MTPVNWLVASAKYRIDNEWSCVYGKYTNTCTTLRDYPSDLDHVTITSLKNESLVNIALRIHVVYSPTLSKALVIYQLC